MQDSRPNPKNAPAASDASATEERLRRYVDARLGAMADELLRAPGFYQRFRVEIWGLLLIATVLALHFRAPAPPPAKSAGPPAASTTTTSPPPPPAALKPNDRWPEWVKAHSAAVETSLRDVLEAKALPAGALSDLQKGNAEKLLKQLQGLDKRDLVFPELRLLLFEFLTRTELAAQIKVDGKIDLVVGDKEYPPAADFAKALLPLALTSAANPRDPDFQAELVMALLEKAGS